ADTVEIAAEGMIRQLSLPYTTHALRCVFRNVIIAAHNLAGIFAIDGTDAEGAASAIAAAGSAGANIKVVGYDSYATNIANMQAGKLAAIVAQQPTLEGKLIIQYAYDRLVHKNAKGIPHLKTLPNILLTPQNCAKLCSTYVYTAS
ncbi:MAG: hypothetical protein B7W95_00495, partial [Acidimicrobiales bacterium 20-64-4]